MQNEVEHSTTDLPQDRVAHLMRSISSYIMSKMGPKITEFLTNIAKLSELLDSLSSSVNDIMTEMNLKLKENDYLFVINMKIQLEKYQKEISILSELLMKYYKDMLEIMNAQFFISLQTSIKETIFNCLNIDFTIKTFGYTPTRTLNVEVPQLDTPENCVAIVETSKNEKKRAFSKDGVVAVTPPNPKHKKIIQIEENKDTISYLLMNYNDISEIKKKIVSIVDKDSLLIEGVDLGAYSNKHYDKLLKKLIAILNWSPFSEIRINKLKCNEEMFVQVIQSMQKSSTLKNVCLENMSIPNMKVFGSLLKDSVINKLSFTDCVIKCVIGHEYAEAFSIISSNYSNLHALELKSCGLNDAMAGELKEALCKNSFLLKLNLSDNGITVKGCRMILNACSMNKTLESISLKGNIVLGNEMPCLQDGMCKRKKKLAINL